MMIVTPVTLQPEHPVRRARLDDTESIASIWRAGWIDGHAGHVPAKLERARLGGSWAASTQRRIDATWVACDGSGRVVGFVTVVDDEVEQLYVAEHVRGSGVATALLRHGELVARSGGAAVAWLAVAHGNRRARRFYEREGWDDGGPMDYLADTPSGPIPVPVRRYERRLRRHGHVAPDEPPSAPPRDRSPDDHWKDAP